MRAFRRSVFAWIALLGLVFTQLAVAAYVCPSWVAAISEPALIDGVPGTPCPEMAAQTWADLDAEQPGLCNQHCASDGQSAETRSVAAVHPTFVLAFVLPAPDPFELAGDELVQQPELLRSTAPPPLWRSRRLRI